MRVQILLLLLLHHVGYVRTTEPIKECLIEKRVDAKSNRWSDPRAGYSMRLAWLALDPGFLETWIEIIQTPWTPPSHTSSLKQSRWLHFTTVGCVLASPLMD